MEIGINANNGERCRNERHTFRIGVDDREATEFNATEDEFYGAIINALIEHGEKKRMGWNNGHLHLQVLTSRVGEKPDWRNCQNPKRGGVVAITPQIAGQPQTAVTLFRWCCNSVQMGRDIDTLADGIAREATE